MSAPTRQVVVHDGPVSEPTRPVVVHGGRVGEEKGPPGVLGGPANAPIGPLGLFIGPVGLPGGPNRRADRTGRREDPADGAVEAPADGARWSGRRDEATSRSSWRPDCRGTRSHRRATRPTSPSQGAGAPAVASRGQRPIHGIDRDFDSERRDGNALSLARHRRDLPLHPLVLAPHLDEPRVLRDEDVLADRRMCR